MGGKAFSGKRIAWAEATALAQKIETELMAKGAARRICVGGSIRRKQPTVGDVDLVVVPFNDFALNAWLVDHFGMQSDKKTPAQSGLIEGVQVDMLLTTDAGWGAACMHMTGSKQTNIKQRAVAIRRGLMLNEKGLFDAKTKERVAGATEQEVYERLGMTWLEPEAR